MRHDEQAAEAREFARDDGLLLVAAGEAAEPRIDAGRAHIILLNEAPRVLIPGVIVGEDAAREGTLPVVLQHQVVHHREADDHAVLLAVLRHVRHAFRGDLARRVVSDIAPFQQDASAGDAAQPADGLHQFGLSVALHAGHAQNLAGAHLQRQPVHGRQATVIQHVQLLDDQHRLARLRRFLLHLQDDVAADHHGGQRLLRGALRLRMAGDAPVAQHRDVVADFEHFLQLVRDENDAHAALLQRAHDGEEALRLLRRQHGSRLVEDEDVGVTIKRLDDLDALLHAHRQVLDQSIGIDGQAVLAGDFEDARARGLAVEEGAAHALVAQHDVLGDCEHRHQLEVLVHHADAQRDGVVGVADADLAAVDEDFALVRAVEAVDDVHQGGFAGAVFAQQAQHLALVQRQVDVVVGQHAGEAPGQPANLEYRRRLAHTLRLAPRPPHQSCEYSRLPRAGTKHASVIR